MRTLYTLCLFAMLSVVACQQNPYPAQGFLRKAPVDAARITRNAWAEDKIACVEKYSRKDFALSIDVSDADAELEVVIEPEAMRSKVEWADQTLFIHSDSEDTEGSHHFKIIARTKHDGYRPSEAKESFFYEVKERCQEASK